MTNPAHEPRWRRQPEERPRQILEAALDVFAERGLAEARLEDIARRAGLSKGTIYLYFPNKEELFREVVRQSLVANIEEGERALTASSMTATEALTRLARTHWTSLRSQAFGTVHRLVLAELRNFPDLAQFYAQEVIARGRRLLTGILERGMASGEFRRMDAQVAARMLIALSVTHGIWCTQGDVFRQLACVSDDQAFDEVMQFYLHALRPETAPAVPGAPTHD